MGSELLFLKENCLKDIDSFVTFSILKLQKPRKLELTGGNHESASI